MNGRLALLFVLGTTACAPRSVAPSTPQAQVHVAPATPDASTPDASTRGVASNSHGAASNAIATPRRAEGMPGPDGNEAVAPADVDHASAAPLADCHGRAMAAHAVCALGPLDLSDEQLAAKLRTEPESLGAISIGKTNAGKLFNAVKMENGEHHKMIAAYAAWGTEETVDYLTRAIAKVAEQFPDGTSPMDIGHISGRKGGRLSPHKSHQAGRDVDVSYYYVNPKHGWYRHAKAKTLDRARTWAFVRALITETDVELILINTSVQRLLKQYALSIGEDREWLDSIFQYRSRHPKPLVKHAPGHGTHIHVRFYNPVAQELGRRAYPHLVAMRKLKPRRYHMRYRARKGDTLGSLANRFGTSVKELQRANRLRSSRIQAKHDYLIPRRGHWVATPAALELPARRLPPGDGVAATAPSDAVRP
jgi:penicillin-insensitive murein endopeptidase